MYFDTHAHYDSREYAQDRAALLAALPAADVSLVLNAACTRRSISEIQRLVDQYAFIYGAAGIHPHDTADMREDDLTLIEKALAHPKIKALGEIGLDYHYEYSDRKAQKHWLARQLDLAARLAVPVIIHDREAHADCLDILKNYPGLPCVFHCYSGSYESAKVLLSMGYYLSFTGVVTYKNAQKSHEVIRKMPLDRLMIETDCPYLSPVPLRGKRNDSRNLMYTAMQIADLVGKKTHQIAEITMENGCKFFNIGKEE